MFTRFAFIHRYFFTFVLNFAQQLEGTVCSLQILTEAAVGTPGFCFIFEKPTPNPRRQRRPRKHRPPQISDINTEPAPTTRKTKKARGPG
jgi:hypothetical protein